ncbi:LIM-domain-containing protein [Peniophora sp. CONT]|nr:LIM-domain-containing protein [Peniophora sp. CONT]
MHPFGGSPRCPRCEKAVYAAEQVMGPGRKLYHKSCLTCKDCNKRLDSYSLVEHDEEPYCKNCHRKLFGNRDLRQQNLPYRPASPERVGADGSTFSGAPLSPTRTGGFNGAPLSPTRTGGFGSTPASPVRANYTGGGRVFGTINMGRPSPAATALLRPTRALSPTRTTFAGGMESTSLGGSFDSVAEEGDPEKPAHEEVAAEDGKEEAEVERVLRLPLVAPGTPTHNGLGRNGMPRTGQLVPSSPTKAVRAPDWDDEDSAGVSVSASTPAATAAATSPPPSNSAPALPPRSLGAAATIGRRPLPLAQTPTGAGAPRYASPLNQTPTGNRFVGGTSPICPRCQKAVYFAEQVKAVGSTWHKACLRCMECNTTLDSKRLTEKEGVPFCHRCYNKLHGPAGNGYALLGKAGG